MSDVNQGGTPIEQNVQPSDPNVNSGNDQKAGAIDWSKVDVSQIPEDVIKKAPTYQNVLTESIQRRQQIKELKERFDKIDEPTKPADPVKPATPADPNDLKAQLDRVTTILSEFANERDLTLREKAASAAGLKPELAVRLQGNNYAEYVEDAKAIAALMGTTTDGNNKSNDNSSPSNPAGDKRDEGMKNRINAYLNGSSATNPFAPGVQKQSGGGAFLKD